MAAFTDPSERLSICRSCGAPVRFVRMISGTLNPLDPAPSEHGNTVLGEGGAYVLTKEEMLKPADGPRYLSHFATCVDAKRWRRRA